MTYYAEDQIDRVVREAFFADFSHRGVVVEVGAAGPEYLSMSKHFRESGWRTIPIEPNPEFCKLYRHAGLEVLEYACGDRDEDNVDFEVVYQPSPYKGGQVTYESFSALRVQDAYRALCPDIDVSRIRVNLRRLDTVLAAHAPDVQKIDILTIDVEGWELTVLAGFSTERYHPTVIIVENLLHDKRYKRCLAERGYQLWRRMSPNEIYVSRGD